MKLNPIAYPVIITKVRFYLLHFGGHAMGAILDAMVKARDELAELGEANKESHSISYLILKAYYGEELLSNITRQIRGFNCNAAEYDAALVEVRKTLADVPAVLEPLYATINGPKYNTLYSDSKIGEMTTALQNFQRLEPYNTIMAALDQAIDTAKEQGL